MNPVLMLVHNNLELTKRAIESVQLQDIPVRIELIDNASTDGTYDWIVQQRDNLSWDVFVPQVGVSKGWNFGLNQLFRWSDHVLVINNDVELPTWFYRRLLDLSMFTECDFITGIAVDDTLAITALEPPPVGQPDPHPDFSAFLIKKPVWDKLGMFSEDMVLYAQDCDYHVRAHRAGIKMLKVNVPYFHVGSGTLKNSNPKERAEIERQANADREVFRSLYGCIPGEPAYEELFTL